MDTMLCREILNVRRDHILSSHSSAFTEQHKSFMPPAPDGALPLAGTDFLDNT